MVNLGPHKEAPAHWLCSWCHIPNYRFHAGEDKCTHCGALVLTRFTGCENDIEIRWTQNPSITPVYLKGRGD